MLLISGQGEFETVLFWTVHRHGLAPPPPPPRTPKNSSGAKLFGENDVVSLSTMCSTLFSGSLFSASGTRLPCAFLAGVLFSRLPRVLVCFFVVFDLLFAFFVLSCRILDSASLFILYVHEHDRLGFGMLTVQTAVFDCIC